jgi:hypothetical protein
MIRPLLLHAPIPPSRGVRVFQILLKMVPAEFSFAPMVYSFALLRTLFPTTPRPYPLRTTCTLLSPIIPRHEYGENFGPNPAYTPRFLELSTIPYERFKRY